VHRRCLRLRKLRHSRWMGKGHAGSGVAFFVVGSRRWNTREEKVYGALKRRSSTSPHAFLSYSKDRRKRGAAVRSLRSLDSRGGCPYVGAGRSTPQVAHDGCYFVFLEEADGGDASGAGFQAGAGVLESYSSQRQHRDICAAGLG
jgi:hypothetical protein